MLLTFKNSPQIQFPWAQEDVSPLGMHFPACHWPHLVYSVSLGGKWASQTSLALMTLQQPCRSAKVKGSGAGVTISQLFTPPAKPKGLKCGLCWKSVGSESKIVINEITSYRAYDSIAVKWKKLTKCEKRNMRIPCSLFESNDSISPSRWDQSWQSLGHTAYKKGSGGGTEEGRVDKSKWTGKVGREIGDAITKPPSLGCLIILH